MSKPNFCESCAGPLVTCDCVNPRPIRVSYGEPDKCWLHLKNGWTVSIWEVVIPATGVAHEVAAWPSTDDATGKTSNMKWFTFKGGVISKRCPNYREMRAALLEVETSQPPK